MLIDAHYDVEGVFANRCRHDDSFDPGCKKRCQAIGGAVFATTLEYDVTIVPIGGLDGFVVTDGHGVLPDLELIIGGRGGGGSPAMHRVVVVEIGTHRLVAIGLVDVGPLHVWDRMPNP